MIDIVRYLILSTLIWGTLVFVYPAISRSGSFEQRRWYLLFTLLAGSLLPLVRWTSPELPVLVVTLPEVDINSLAIQSGTSALAWSWTDLLISVYLAGFLLTLGYYIRGMIRLVRLCRQGLRSSYENSPIHLLPFPIVPFHVLGRLYFPMHLTNDRKAFEMAFRHEQAHQQLGHGMDLILGNFFRLIFWFQPLIPWILRELRQIHEYQADQTVIHDLERDTYARFLGSFHSTQFTHPAIHTLNHSPLKQRIMQMYKTPTTWKLPHFALLLVLVSMLLGTTAFKGVTWVQNAGVSMIDTIPDADRPVKADQGVESLSQAEVMPRFPGCEDQGLGEMELKQCAQRKMLEYVYTHLKYPEEALKKGIEGTSIVSFVVEKDGSLSTFKIVRDIGGGTGEETTRVLQQMQEDGIRWIPGEQDGQKVRVEFMLPVKFKLTDDSSTTSPKKRRKTN